MNIAILGFGVVGQGLYRIIEQQRENYFQKTEQHIEVKAILVKNLERERETQCPTKLLTTDFQRIIEDDSIDVIVEVTSEKEKAVEYIQKSLQAKKHVVTANKAAIALDFFNLQKIAKENQVHLKFEASVAGGIPVLSSLSKLIAFNQIDQLYGIINSSTNYVLSELTAGKELSEVIAAAQTLGVLEADPTDDLEGYDARRKLTILSMMILGVALREENMPLIGITRIENEDIAILSEQGYQVKLIAELICHQELLANHEYMASVMPTAIQNCDFASVNGLMNEVAFKGNYCDELRFTGKGGTMYPTANALMTDIYELSMSQPLYFSEKNLELENQALLNKSRYYLRIPKSDLILEQVITDIENITDQMIPNQENLVIISNEISLEAAMDLYQKGAHIVRINENVL